MSVQKLRIKKGFSYTSISNKVIQNLKNYEALGLYTYLLSLPEDWTFYKKQLSDHAGIGREKINSLLKILLDHNLIEYAQMRKDSGQFAQLDLHVKDGTDFKINDLENCAPLTEKPLTANRLPVNSIYIENNNKENNNTNKISKNLCATDVAQSRFEEFWNIYPRKKDKKRSRDIWQRKKYDKIATLILEDIQNRILNDAQWKNEQYIPHPATYLRNERWEDEITLEKLNQKNKKETPLDRALRVFKNTSGENTWTN